VESCNLPLVTVARYDECLKFVADNIAAKETRSDGHLFTRLKVLLDHQGSDPRDF
jgi:hypothetical protein